MQTTQQIDQMDPRQAKLQKYIDEGRESVLSALQSIQREFEIRKDRQVKPSALAWNYGTEGLTLDMRTPQGQTERLRMTDHSTGQAFDRIGFPRTYAAKLQTLDRSDLILHNLHQLQPLTIGDGALVRSVGETVKGFLSPAYRRMDAAPILDQYLEGSLQAGMVPYRGTNSDFRYQINMLFPTVLQPVPGEYIVIGTSITTGDYGSQALQLAMLILRITCRNLAMGSDLFRRVHLGSRFSMGDDQNVIDISDRTHKLDSMTVASAVKDITKTAGEQARQLETAIVQANNKEITEDKAKAIYENLKKRGIKKATVDAIKTAYETTPESVDLLPAARSAWRMSNAISLIANSDKLTADAKIDLEAEAFNLLGMSKKADDPRQATIDVTPSN